MTQKNGSKQGVAHVAGEAGREFTPPRDRMVPVQSAVACPICQVLAGQPCVRISDGQVAPGTHRARRRMAVRAQNEGDVPVKVATPKGRAVCPVCGHEVRRRQGGWLADHRATNRAVTLCPGSGTR